jgi:hypothetical protein
MKGLAELGVLPHPIAVAANSHQVAVVNGPIDEGHRHDVDSEICGAHPQLLPSGGSH